jgi:alpha-1,2-mannosyltransferase
MDSGGEGGHRPLMGIGFLREAHWLKGRMRGYLVLFALLNVATLVFLLATSRGGVDRNGFLPGSDFLSFWTSGRMLLAGGSVYDQAAHIAAQGAYFVQKDGAFTAFFYPPSFLPVCLPLGLMGYFPALAAWLLATGALYAAAVTGWLRDHAPSAPSRWLLLAAFPPVLITITHGQTSFLVAGLLGLATLLVARAPVLSGVLFGLATIKPQFGLLVPLALLLTGEWRVIAAAATSAIALAAASTAMFGLDQWSEWAALSTGVQAAMDQGAVGFAKMMSTFAAARLLGAPVATAYALQAMVSLGVAAALALAAWRTGWNPALGAAMLAGAPLATPFVLDYDMVILAFPLIWLAAREEHLPWERITVALAFAAPAFARPLAMNAGIPIMPLVLLALFALVTRRALSERRTMVTGQGASA